MDNKLELNRLKVQREHLFRQLKTGFELHYERGIHFDVMSLANLYCEHQCGIESEFSERALEIETIDQEIEKIQGETFWPKWRAARMIVNHLIQSGRLNTQEQFDKAAKFLTHVESILSEDTASNLEIKNQEGRVVKKNDRLEFLVELLHPRIVEHSLAQYRNGHLRDAVLNAFIAVGDLTREKTGAQLDGSALATQVLSLTNPKIILSDLESESGKNTQLGFMYILQGVFIGIRNPIAHSLHHDLTENEAAQYLILASILARKISESLIADDMR